MSSSSTLLPGATLGMLGGGQLARMFVNAAHNMGYQVMVLDPDSDSPAGRIADKHICKDYTDKNTLARFAKSCDAITTEFENIPASTLSFLEDKTIVHPSSSALSKAQNRITEKQFIESLAIKVVPYVAIYNHDDIDNIADTFQFPAILKTATFGYDGKGQIPCDHADDVRLAFTSLKKVACVLEARINLAGEASAVVARSQSGDVTHFPVVDNIHINGILHASTVPSSLSSQQTDTIVDIARAIADGLDYIGVMAVEFFIADEGDILVNEIAPRPHNSGHFSLDACQTSQFEQQVRMLCGLTAGDCTLTSPAVMINLLGDVWDNGKPHWDKLLSRPQNKLHLYGKKEVRQGRKMGHFNVLADNTDQAMQIAQQTFHDLIA